MDLNCYLSFCRHYNFNEYITRKDMIDIYEMSLNSKKENKYENKITFIGFEECLIRLSVYCFERDKIDSLQEDKFNIMIDYLGCNTNSWKLKLGYNII